MTAPPGAVVPSKSRRNHLAGPVSTDTLIRDTCALLAGVGVRTGRSKIARIVRRYVERVQFTGYSFDRWIGDQVALDAEQRAQTAWGLRNLFGVLDPTGQTAARSVDQQLRLGRGWSEDSTGWRD